MGEPLKAIARLLGLLLAAACLATSLATAPALLGEVELAGVEETEATLNGWLATGGCRGLGLCAAPRVTRIAYARPAGPILPGRWRA
jgi:hypothetical protein